VPVARWKENLTVEEVATIELLVRKEMLDFGYELQNLKSFIPLPKRLFLAGKMFLREMRWKKQMYNRRTWQWKV
jgi:hypothetical protein